jgi:hypothetical protein
MPCRERSRHVIVNHGSRFSSQRGISSSCLAHSQGWAELSEFVRVLLHHVMDYTYDPMRRCCKACVSRVVDTQWIGFDVDVPRASLRLEDLCFHLGISTSGDLHHLFDLRGRWVLASNLLTAFSSSTGLRLSLHESSPSALPLPPSNERR